MKKRDEFRITEKVEFWSCRHSFFPSFSDKMFLTDFAEKTESVHRICKGRIYTGNRKKMTNSKLKRSNCITQETFPVLSGDHLNLMNFLTF